MSEFAEIKGELIEARRQLHEERSDLACATKALAVLEDEVVYEFQNYIFRLRRVERRTVEKTTGKQIRLAPTHEGGCRTFLSRQSLEAGEFVRRGRSWYSPVFAYGWAIRSHLEKQVAFGERRIEQAKKKLASVLDKLADSEIGEDERERLLCVLGIKNQETETVGSASLAPLSPQAAIPTFVIHQA